MQRLTRTHSKQGKLNTRLFISSLLSLSLFPGAIQKGDMGDINDVTTLWGTEYVIATMKGLFYVNYDGMYNILHFFRLQMAQHFWGFRDMRQVSNRKEF